MCSIKRLKTIKEIDNVFKASDYSVPKENFKVLIIDDQPKSIRPLIEQCKKNDYIIDLTDDFESVEKCRKYDAILVDIRGVGDLYSDDGGFGVAKSLSDVFPDKEIVLFTAYEIELVDSKSRFRVINKPIKADKLCSELDLIRQEMADPLKGWEKIKNKCLQANVPFKYIALLEDKYVRSYIKGKSQFNTSFNNAFAISKIEDAIISLTAQIITNVLLAKM